MDDEEFDMMLFLFLKLHKKKVVKTWKKAQVLDKVFEKFLILCTFFDFCQTDKDNS